MSTEYAHTNDGYVTRYQQASWSDARNNTTGTAASSITISHFTGIAGERISARGGGLKYSIFRSFMFFDTSSITDTVSDVTLKIRGYSQGVGDCIVLKATSDIETLGTADFGSITGWDETTDGAGGGDNEGNVTKYSDEITSWSTSGYNDITLNSTAKTDMENNDTLHIALVNFDYDLKDIAPTGYTSNRNGLFFTDYTGTSYDPYLDYTVTAAVTDNATFFGANF